MATRVPLVHPRRLAAGRSGTLVAVTPRQAR